MRQAFVSYARENKPDIETLVGHLNRLGCPTWFDSNLQGGQDWWQEILRRIADSDVFVAIVSEATLKSVPCARELRWARQLNKPVLPLALEKIPEALPEDLATLHIVDYSEHGEERVFALAGALNGLPPAPPPPDPLPTPPEAPLSYLTDLIGRVGQSEPLTYEQQHQIVVALQPALGSADPDERQGGLDILEAFRKRHDLYAEVGRILDQLGGTDESRRADDVERDYERAVEAQAAGEWEKADDLYAKILAARPRYRDVAERLQQCRTARQVAELQGQLRQYAENANWQAVIDTHRELTRLDASAADRAFEQTDPDTAVAIGDVALSADATPVAVNAYRRAAAAGKPEAMVKLGTLLADKVDPPELAAARDWFEKAAQAGDTKGMRSLGILLADKVDPPELTAARDWLTKAAEAGDTDAMTHLGNLLADKVDPPQLTAASDWLTKAAEAGDTDAMTHLGILLADKVDPPDVADARRWLEKAAQAGNTYAMKSLGILLADKVDPPELTAARDWLTKAAEAGDTYAMRALGLLLAHKVDPPDMADARRWLEKAAQAGNTDAMTSLAILLAEDPPDLDGARRWYEKAARAGNLLAALLLGDRLLMHSDDITAARYWLEKPAQDGWIDAMFALGVALQRRPRDLAGARYWFEKAAEAGNIDAMKSLGYLLADELSPPDLDGARRWYGQAARAGDADAKKELLALKARSIFRRFKG
ncbi:toll/interleukin-1 receptor domain-containing protein [Mycobacterium sp.]|uniref:toll/interleukin-1 receptor domain-containing protein n=1 Tax=Mycobacterium sp. TaxID=1785 RepID=UPI002C567FBA|nr:toll/interleukin-1 receptor domain-containing protein [Mycobacterium sp.]HTY32492.1 toll/interleukin-1 receptor domain-containing protein [Mycobacterium sp.]